MAARNSPCLAPILVTGRSRRTPAKIGHYPLVCLTALIALGVSATIAAERPAVLSQSPTDPPAKAPAARSRTKTSGTSCRVVRHGQQRQLESPAFVYRLDFSDGLTAESWLNRLTGSRISLGSHPEIELEVDASEQRLFITGWRTIHLRSTGAEPNKEEGYLKGFASAGFDDSSWRGRVTPVSSYDTDVPLFRDYCWARTHVFLPPGAEGKDISLVLGGVGLYDFSFMRVFINGHEVGVREIHRRWNEPGVFDLGPKSAVRQHLRFGQDNIIALQLSGLVTRTARLNELDPRKGRSFVFRYYWPGQFEQYLTVGTPLRTPKLHVTRVETTREGDRGELKVTLRGDRPALSAIVTYRWNGTEPVLHKFAEIQNKGSAAIRLMNVRLGSYSTGMTVSEGEQGFPVYVGNQFFTSVAHPSGWATGQEGEVRLRQYPGQKLRPGERFACMETVLGVAAVGEARPAFLDHVQSRLRRVQRGHDKAYAIFESFGSWPSGDFWGATEDHSLKQIEQVVAAEQRAGCRYDLYTIELWRDVAGDIERPDPKRFPTGFHNIQQALEKLGIDLGLWTCTSLAGWSIGGNPVIGGAYTHDPAYGPDEVWLCLATDPLKTMFVSAFREHIRKNRLRLLKLDGTSAICYNPTHDHLPGLYSTEAIQNALIDILRQLDQECPELFLMLYWGARSPWWLLHADTLFEPSLQIEAAHPSAAPALYVRDSVTLGLDQAQWWAEDIPPLGKDSLGVWLSAWPWNSSIGKERWQEGFVMDMCRGSLLAQPWSDDGSLSEAERQLMADFIALLKERTDCFRNPRFIVGNPWKPEAYGYACSNGRRAFVALNNYSWSDTSLRLELGPAWGLPENGQWEIYRWYPDPARLAGEKPAFGSTASVSLRPYETVLLEVVPTGTPPSLNRSFASKAIPATFAEPSRELSLSITPEADRSLPVPLEQAVNDSARANLPPKRSLAVRCQVPSSQRGGTVMIALEMRKGDTAALLGNVGTHFAAQATLDGKPAALEAVLPRATFAAPWQGWRIAIGPADRAQEVELLVSAMIAAEVETVCHGYFIPARD